MPAGAFKVAKSGQTSLASTKLFHSFDPAIDGWLEPLIS